MATAILRSVVVAALNSSSSSSPSSTSSSATKSRQNICKCDCHKNIQNNKNNNNNKAKEQLYTNKSVYATIANVAKTCYHCAACNTKTNKRFVIDSNATTEANRNTSEITTLASVKTEQKSAPNQFRHQPEPEAEGTVALHLNTAALGTLKRKQSPLFGRSTPTRTKSFSLRTQSPFYAKQVLYADDTIACRNQQQKQQSQFHVDQTAIEAINMNVGVTNGSRKTLSASSTFDFNRNNGYMSNGTIMTTTNTEKREHLYKILVIGELGTGKTSFIKRYVHQFFSQNYRATIGVDFALKVLHWDSNTIVRLQLWDIAGQERFGNMTRVYYKEAVGAFIVFDVTRSGTFDCVSKWKEDLDSKVQLPDGSPIPCILLANKCDQDKQGIVTTPEKMEEYVRENGFAGWFETSAKENINIDEAARALVNKILLNDKLITDADLADSEKFNLNNMSGEDTTTENKNKCSC